MTPARRPPSRVAAAFAVLLIWATPAAAETAPAVDDQFWSEVDVSAHLSKRLDLTVTVVDRQGEGLPNPTLWGGGPTADFRLSPNWSIGAGAYEVQVRSPASGGRLDATLPLAYAAGAWSFAGVRLSDRNRVEDIVGLPGDPWRYRNRLMIERPLRSVPPLRAVFVSDEVFYDFSRRRTSRNRAQVGVTLAPVGPADLQVYFMRQDDADARPGGLDILGLTLKIDLDRPAPSAS